MSISMAPGPFNYNRFDDLDAAYKALYEKKCEDDKEKDEDDDKEDKDEKKSKKKGKFWQDSDGDGKWYEKGEDVKEEYVDEAMMAGPRRDAMMAKAQHPATTTKDKANIHNIAVRNDTGPSYQKKSTGGKGSRYAGYGDRGAGNKAARRMGMSPMRESVCEYLINEGFTDNEVSAEVMFNHMSEEWIESILEAEADRGAKGPVSGDEAMERHGIKKHEGPMKVQKLPAKKAPKRRK